MRTDAPAKMTSAPARLFHETRGAALLIVLGILVILFAIALTFYTTARFELRSATNYRNSVQTDSITAAGLAYAIATLAHDRAIHAAYTSLDHAWRTYYNGTWMFGKPWVAKPGNTVPPNVPGHWPRIEFPPNATDACDALYIPRRQNNANDPFGDFLVPSERQSMAAADTLPAQFVDQLLGPRDVAGNRMYSLGADNDGDGLLDSMWIPVPMDRILDNDGIDNDLDGFTDGLDNNGEVVRPGETGVFLYWGGNDGLDNDGDGYVDEPDEQRIFLTCPMDQIRDGSGALISINWSRVQARVNLAALRAYANIPEDGRDPDISIDPNRVDRLDNDRDFIVNEADYHVIPSPAPSPNQRAKAYSNVIAPDYHDRTDVVVTAAGEPVCDIVGRVAVLITDENSKVNLNAAHAMSREEDAAYAAAPMVRALDQGIGPQEYDTRVIKGPGSEGFGVARAAYVRNLLHGSPDGTGLAIANANASSLLRNPEGEAAALAPYLHDMALPGYGRVDDNGNALPLSMNGLDDDGDGLIDEGLWIPDPPAADAPNYDAQKALYDRYVALFGRTLEGIDEPQEFQRYRPYRNLVAERSDPDTLRDFFPNGAQIGSLADRILRTTTQIQAVTDIAPSRFDAVRRFVTVNSTDRNDRFWVRVSDALSGVQNQRGSIAHPYPTGSGLKLDLNHAFADEIARALVEDWDYSPPRMVIDDAWMPTFDMNFPEGQAACFALGLRQESGDITAGAFPVFDLGSGLRRWGELQAGGAYQLPADRELRAYQIGAGVQDFRDADFTRTDVKLTVNDPFGSQITGQSKQITYTQAGIENIRINELMVRPVRRVEAEATPSTSADHAMYGNFDHTPYQILPMFGVSREFAIARPSGGRILPGIADRLLYPEGIDPDHVTDSLTQWRVWPNTLVLGAGATLQTSVSTIPLQFAELPDSSPGEMPNIVEFAFSASQGLPPGRYYLMMNIWDNEGSYKDMAAGEIRYAVKYVQSAPPAIPWATNKSAGPSTILADVIGGISAHPDASATLLKNHPYWRTPVLEAQGSPAVGTGTTFLPGSLFRNGTAAPGYAQDSAFTIEIPPAGSGVELHVAIWASAASNANPIAINFFDFSQEPDHEWVEVQNVAKYDPAIPFEQQVIDMSGWKLQTRVKDLDTGDPKDIEMIVPDRTRIAPGGSLLLGFNKFDELADDSALTPSNRLLWNNGIGLAATRGAGALATALAPTFPWLATVTAPPFPMDPFLLGMADYADLGNSVFSRDTGEDFVDADGDGVLDANSPDDAVQSSAERGPDGPLVSALGIDPKQKPWDRIVELQCPDEIQFTGAETEPEVLEKLAAMLFRGGMLPNYPEFDGIDNDGDNLVLSNDGVNNTGSALLPDGVTPKEGDEPNEGIDEGRWRYEWTGTQDPFNSSKRVSVPGSYSDQPMVAQTRIGLTIALTSDAFPPEWKAFVERRFFPGDNVIITLRDNNDHLVDRVTYRQKDVENSAIDDKLSYGTNPENGSLPNVWPDNTMGFDFYKTLERRHPLYAGDVYGTQNRWQATDGNYDDWAPNMGIGPTGALTWMDTDIYYRVLGPAGPIPWPQAFGHALQGSPLRANFEQRLIDDWKRYNPGGGFSMANLYTPSVPSVPGGNDITWAPRLATARSRALASAADLMAMPQFSFSKAYGTNSSPLFLSTLGGAILGQAFTDVVGQNNPIDNPPPGQPDVAPGDFTALMNIASMDSQTLSVGQATFYPLYPTVQYVNGDGTYVGWNTAHGFAPPAWAPLMLFGPVSPDANADSSALLPADAALAAKLSWYGYDYALAPAYLMEPPLASAFDDLSRWPLRQRAAMYVSTNRFPNFFPSSLLPAADGARYSAFPPLNAVDNAHGAEALFVWDGASGLENGEYNVYVQVNSPLDALRAAHTAGGKLDPPRSLLTALGGRFVQEAQGSLPQDVLVDVEFFTDRNGDGRCWREPSPNPQTLAGDNLPQQGELDRGNNTRAGDSFGEMRGVQPNSEGLIHYGLVRVENNYLALMLRNWSAPGQIVRFSGIVLAPRKRTPGRININTAETRRAFDLGNTSATGPLATDFNPLLGIPGVLAQTAWIADPIFPNLDRLNITYPADSLGLSPSDVPWRNAALDLSRKIMQQRGAWRWNDGRYFRYPSDLALDVTNMNAPNVELPADTDAPVLQRAVITAADVDEIKRRRFREVMARYSRMANLVTTRSDTFEIIVTGQSGYVRDDGDYRVDFEVMGEKQTRTIYER